MLLQGLHFKFYMMGNCAGVLRLHSTTSQITFYMAIKYVAVENLERLHIYFMKIQIYSLFLWIVRNLREIQIYIISNALHDVYFVIWVNRGLCRYERQKSKIGTCVGIKTIFVYFSCKSPKKELSVNKFEV